jgi:hypothetical protein
MHTKLTESHKDLVFHLFIKYFLIFGTELSFSYLQQILCQEGARAGSGGGFGGDGLENHLKSHAFNGNWKKFKNCLKTFMR